MLYNDLLSSLIMIECMGAHVHPLVIVCIDKWSWFEMFSSPFARLTKLPVLINCLTFT